MQATSYNRRELMQMLSVAMIGTAASSITMAAPVTAQPIYIPKGTGKALKIGGAEMLVKLDKTQTNGHLGCVESVLAPGHLGAPPHLHNTFDELCYVLEGAVHIMVENEVTKVQAGDWHLRPKGLMHTFWNSGDTPAKTIEIGLPGGHEEYLKDLATLFENGKGPKPADFVVLAQKHDIVYFWDKLPLIMQKYSVHL